MSSGTEISQINYENWPFVRFRMPEKVADEIAQLQVIEFEKLLDRQERFVLVFDGPMLPSKSKKFMKLYANWAKTNKEVLGKLCAGAVRVELKKKSLLSMATTYAMGKMMPYPYTVVGSDAEAEKQGQEWMGN